MNITHGLRRALQVNPRGVAILEGERKLTWAEVGERVGRLSGALRQLGVAKGDRVAVLMLNSGRYAGALSRGRLAGAVIVPLNIRWSVAENQDALRDCGARSDRRQRFYGSGRALQRRSPHWYAYSRG